MLYADVTHPLTEDDLFFVTDPLVWEAPDLSEPRFDSLTEEQLIELVHVIHDVPDPALWGEADMLTIDHTIDGYDEVAS
jgi:hypothetical protein